VDRPIYSASLTNESYSEGSLDMRKRVATLATARPLPLASARPGPRRLAGSLHHPPGGDASGRVRCYLVPYALDPARRAYAGSAWPGSVPADGVITVATASDENL
jgi:hypothetical protein